MEPDDYDDFYDDGLPSCPHCNGDGYVNCHCGGDLCVCENYGEAPCPVCFGEGEVSEARYQQYMDNLRKHAEMRRAALAAEKPHE